MGPTCPDESFFKKFFIVLIKFCLPDSGRQDYEENFLMSAPLQICFICNHFCAFFWPNLGQVQGLCLCHNDGFSRCILIVATVKYLMQYDLPLKENTADIAQKIAVK